MGIIENFEAMLEQGQDNAMLRYGLGNAYLGEGRAEEAIPHLAKATEHDPLYSAAWKAWGQALMEAGRPGEAAEVFERGIGAADERGDRQAAKEMQVFRKRATKAAGGE
ncbi:MAG: tetratricopeptide repeat protein [Thiohalospira sp.]|uniref:tetratricopeptide repeat protein n=1 Tax=Thiohalospira sp. TaxID=3080549 RepID=UPI00397EB3DA